MASPTSTTASGSTAGQPFTDIVWNEIVRACMQGKDFVMVIPPEMANVIGEEGMNLLKMRCRTELNSEPQVTSNETTGFYHFSLQAAEIVTEQTSVSGSVTAPPQQNANGKSGKPPRPPNSFILYRQHHHPRVVAANRHMHNNQICKLIIPSLAAFTDVLSAQIIGRMWQGEPQTTKDNWKHIAELVKLQHEKDHPGYQYQPRKPSEKKRRGSKRRQPQDEKVDLALRELEKYLTSSPPVPLPEISVNEDDIATFTFDAADSGQLDALDDVLTKDLACWDGEDPLAGCESTGIVSIMPSALQEAEARVFGVLDNADAINDEILEVEDELDQLLRAELDNIAAGAVPDDSQTFHGAERFHNFLDGMPEKAWVTGFVEV